MQLLPRSDRPLGVYIHFPFCLRRCPYCDFTVRVARTIPHEAYAQAVLEELRARAPRFAGRRLVSIYFGGGTPGLWKASCVEMIIGAIRELWALYNDPRDCVLEAAGGNGESALEVTIEINPRLAPREQLEALRSAGVNRLSVGVQSFDASYLEHLGRDHGVQQAIDTLEAAREVGWNRLSFDLLFGGPGHSRAIFDRDLERAGTVVHADHISAYSLIVEPETPFGRLHARGKLNPCTEEEVVALLDQCQNALERAGYVRYEISNYARAGRYARHNSLYWTGGEYMGLGVGAHEFSIEATGHRAFRRSGVKALRAYMADPGNAQDFEEEISPRVHLAERLYLGLRTCFGVSMEDLAAQFGQEGADIARPLLEELVEKGWIEPATRGMNAPAYLVTPGERFAPTRSGMLWADEIAMVCL